MAPELDDEKRSVADQLLSRGSLFVHLDPRHPDVQCPTWLRNQAQLVLQLGTALPIPILDLRVDEVGFSGTLSFSHHPILCSAPWEAIFALIGEDGQGKMWPACMPPEIADQVQQEERDRAAAEAKPAKSPSSRPPYLRIVK